MPSDKFVRNDDANVFLVHGFNMGTSTADQGGSYAIVMNLLCAGKGAILVIIPENAYMDFIEHLGKAKALIEERRAREVRRNPAPILNVLSGGADGKLSGGEEGSE